MVHSSSSMFVDALQPLERLNVYDGLIMNAERWQVSQQYMRQRQNLHFQSVHQAGIVSGLGVKVLSDPPEGIDDQIRKRDELHNEQRWLKIQPGMAIDQVGNPIIVNWPRGAQHDQRSPAYWLAPIPPTSGELTVYIVLKYVDPDPPLVAPDADDADDHKIDLYSPNVIHYAPPPDPTQPNLPEGFRLRQQTTPPSGLEIELCRVQLRPGPIRLKMPRDPLKPGIGELDFTHRPIIQAKPSCHVRVGVVGNTIAPSLQDSFQCLAQAAVALYPSISIELVPHAVNPDQTSSPDNYDLLYVGGQNLKPFIQHMRPWLEQFVCQRGIVLIETPSLTLPPLPQQNFMFGPLEQVPWQATPPHSLRMGPFLFTQAPQIGGKRIEIAIAESDGVRAMAPLLWVGGGLSKLWGSSANVSRQDTRAAHELGINIIHYVWQQQHLRQLYTWE